MLDQGYGRLTRRWTSGAGRSQTEGLTAPDLPPQGDRDAAGGWPTAALAVVSGSGAVQSSARIAVASGLFFEFQRTMR